MAEQSDDQVPKSLARISKAKDVSEGFQIDISDFLEEFKANGTLRFEDFAKIWKNRSFDCIFMYREELEIGLFIDECFKCLVKAFSNEEVFNNKVAFLYFIYGIYFRQPIKDKIKVRVTLQHMEEFKSFAEKAQINFHFDVGYVFWSLFHKNAFLFVYRIDTDMNQSNFEPVPLEKRSIIEEYISEEQIDHLSLLHDKYSSLKSIQDSNAIKNLRVYDPDFITHFKERLNDLKQRFNDPEYNSNTGKNASKQLTVRRDIRNRALATKPNAPKSITSKFVTKPSTSKD